jgi:hypothetical protein
MGKRNLLVILWLLSVLPGVSHAQINKEADLDNFRGMKWGMDIAQLSRNEFTEENPVGDITVFVRNNEDLNVLGVNANKISYNFRANRFWGVFIRFSLNRKDELSDSLKEYLGKPSDLKKGSDLTLDVIWRGDNIWVKEHLDFKRNYILLFITSHAEIAKEAIKRS